MSWTWNPVFSGRIRCLSRPDSILSFKSSFSRIGPVLGEIISHWLICWLLSQVLVTIYKYTRLHMWVPSSYLVSESYAYIRIPHITYIIKGFIHIYPGPSPIYSLSTSPLFLSELSLCSLQYTTHSLHLYFALPCFLHCQRRGRISTPSPCLKKSFYFLFIWLFRAKLFLNDIFRALTCGFQKIYI